MKIRFQHILFPIISLLLLVASLPDVQAQSQQGNSGRGFTVVAWKALPYSALYYRNGKNFYELEINPGRRSKFYPLPVIDTLGIYTTEKDSEGKEQYKLLGKAKMLANAKKMLFVIVENKKEASGLPLALIGMNDSFSVFPVGSFRFMNFTSIPLEVDFNRKKSRLKPRASTVIKSNVPKGGGFIPFYIKTLKGMVLFETRLLGQPTGREIVFITPPSNQKRRVNIKFLPQSVLPPPPKPDNG